LAPASPESTAAWRCQLNVWRLKRCTRIAESIWEKNGKQKGSSRPWFLPVSFVSRACTHWPEVGGALVATRKRPGDTGDVKAWERVACSNSPGQASQNQLLETRLLDGRIHQNCSFSSLAKRKLRTQMTSDRARALYQTEHPAANPERYTEHRGLPRAKRLTAKITVK
jgi:hypothetical protein